MDKIIVEVKSGVVQAVYSSNPKIEVRLLDYDCIDTQNMTEQEKELQSEIRVMENIL